MDELTKETRWNEAKQKVEGLPANFGEVMRARLSAYPYSIEKFKSGKLDRTILTLPQISGNDVFMHILEKDGLAEKVRYVMFEFKGNRSFVKDLL